MLSWSASSRAQPVRQLGALHPLARRPANCARTRARGGRGPSSAVARAARARTRGRSRASRSGGPVAREQAVVGERWMPSSASRAADRLGGREREAAGEDAELRRTASGRGVEQVVAPADRGAQRLLALRRVARAGAQQVQAAREAVEDLGGREDLGAGGGELDRQRQAVELRADLLDARVAVVELQARVDGAGAAQEQRGGGLARERAERQLVLGGEPQRRAAGDDELRSAARRPAAAPSSGAASSSCSKLSTTSSSSRLVAVAERAARAPAPTCSGILERAERDEARALGELGAERVRELEREAGLADPARAGEREQAHAGVAQQLGAVARSSSRPSSGCAGSGRAGAGRRPAAARRRRPRASSAGSCARIAPRGAGARGRARGRARRSACGGRAGRRRARRPGGPRGRARASAARGSARGTGARA